MQITIENVEHLTLDLGDKPKSPLFTAMLNSLVTKAPTVAPEADPEAVQSTAQTATPALKIGEYFAPAAGVYAGISRGEDSQPDGHIFLLADKPRKMDWAAAVKWAESLGNGARLPSKSESALIYANLKDQVDEEWHWTGTQYSDGSAWYQYFTNGYQDSYLKTYEGRARAVRRLIL
jgi:hypothetical protein